MLDVQKGVVGPATIPQGFFRFASKCNAPAMSDTSAVFEYTLLTVTFTVCWVVCDPAPVHVSVYAPVPVAVGVTDMLPDCACEPDHQPLAVQLVASVLDQVTFADCPSVSVVGATDMEMAGATGEPCGPVPLHDASSGAAIAASSKTCLPRAIVRSPVRDMFLSPLRHLRCRPWLCWLTETSCHRFDGSDTTRYPGDTRRLKWS